MSRFGTYCKRCRCFVENIDSEEVRQGMYKQDRLCFAGEDPYQCGTCKFFLDIQEPLDEIVREIGLSGNPLDDRSSKAHEKAPANKTSGKDAAGAKHLDKTYARGYSNK